MWASENHGIFLGRLSTRRNQVASMGGDVEDLEFFHRKISDCFSNLLPSSQKGRHNHAQSYQQKPPISESAAASDASTSASVATETAATEALLSIGWLRELLDVFLCCEAEFKVVLMGREPSHLVKSPLDKLIPELLDRYVKALDICNAITHGVEAIRHVQKQAEIVVSAFEQKPFTDGQSLRARKALTSLLTSIVVAEEQGNRSKSTNERSWSSGRRSGSSTSEKDRPPANFRSLSWTVSTNWSAAKQIQAICSNLYAPRGGESTGLAMTVYTMSVVLAFVMWALVSAIPCQDRNGLPAHISLPKQSGWAKIMCGLQEKFAEDWKKKVKRGAAGLMDEVVKVEKAAQSLIDLLDGSQSSMEAMQELEVAAQVAELAETCQRMEEGLGPLQLRIREVFHRIVMSRAELLDKAAEASMQSE
ncbi:hypothetical protein Nepgr_011215 [Nepenthes gracilis]|uniref:Uncharacterized protein n=1 Tax=Nepenthes gracilis TaxID=150966 RepID=A0AAD3XM33_NEPGR|nr:hypothetical protein Nepgr_011215 [Nepenthes gracilis]